jgi:hypothetical protein
MMMRLLGRLLWHYNRKILKKVITKQTDKRQSSIIRQTKFDSRFNLAWEHWWPFSAAARSLRCTNRVFVVFQICVQTEKRAFEMAQKKYEITAQVAASSDTLPEQRRLFDGLLLQ